MGAAGGLLVAVPALCAFLLWPWIAPPPRGTGERLGYSVPAGVVLVVTAMLLQVYLADRFTLAGLLVPLGVLALLTLAAGRRRGAPRLPPPGARPGWVGRLALVVILVELGLVLREIAVNPSLSDWDAWAIWGVKAKAFFVDRGVGGYLGRADFYDFSWPARPCLTSLFQAFVYTCRGRVDEAGVRLVHVALACSLLLTFHGSLRRRFGADSALVWTAVLATVPNLTYQASAGLANLVLGLFLFATLTALEAWESDRRLAHLVGPALLLGGALLARDEGLMLGGLAVAVFVLVRGPGRRLRDSLGPGLGVLLGAGALYGLWYVLVLPHAIWDIRSMWFEADVFPRLLRHRQEIPAILLGVGRELARPAEQTRSSPLEDAVGLSLFWPLFGLACVVLLGRRGGSDLMGRRCAVVAAGGVSIYTLGLILFPYQDLADVMNNWLYVLDRHALALAPMAARAAAAAFSLDPEADSAPSIATPPEEHAAPARS
jgi:hypothetical protein